MPDFSRRDLAALLPALLSIDSTASGESAPLPSKIWKWEELPVKSNGANRSRAVMKGSTHDGYAIEMHQTEVAPGERPHAPHRHGHEELMMLREGTLEVTVNGSTATIGPGSAVYVASNEEHGWKNTGTVPAHYFVIAFGNG